MGVSSDLVFGNKNEIEKILASDNPVKEFGGIYSRLDMVPLCILMDIISNTDNFDKNLDQFEILNEPTEENPERPLISTIHPDFKDLLYSINRSNISDIAKKWSETEDLEDWPQKALKKEIKILIKCFKKADKLGKDVYMVLAM